MLKIILIICLIVWYDSALMKVMLFLLVKYTKLFCGINFTKLYNWCYFVTNMYIS
jgi:hypothetical protein